MSEKDPRWNLNIHYHRVFLDAVPAKTTTALDVVVASAMLHHIDARTGLRRMKELVRPGGVVVVVGFGRPDGLQDRLQELAGAMARRVHVIRHEYWEHNAPTLWPPPFTLGEMCELGVEK